MLVRPRPSGWDSCLTVASRSNRILRCGIRRLHLLAGAIRGRREVEAYVSFPELPGTISG